MLVLRCGRQQGNAAVYCLAGVRCTGILVPLADRCVMSRDKQSSAIERFVFGMVYRTLLVLGIFLSLKTFFQAVKDILDDLGRGASDIEEALSLLS